MSSLSNFIKLYKPYGLYATKTLFGKLEKHNINEVELNIL